MHGGEAQALGWHHARARLPVRARLETDPAAAHELLRVIARAHADPQQVFEAIAYHAVQLCAAKHASLATHNVSAERKRLIEDNPIVPGRDSAVGRAALGRCTVHITDALADPELTYWTYKIPSDPTRTVLVTPMLNGSALLGVIFIHRNEVQPFSASQVALLEAFADQAVIAIENAHLFEEVQARTRELTEALEQQTATSEVLSVISSSPGDLEPVFRAMLVNAMRICEAKFGHLLLYDGESFRAAHLHGVPQSYRSIWERGPISPGPSTGLGRMVHTKQVFHIPDITTDAVYSEGDPLRVATVELAGARTILGVPMLKDLQLIGAIVIYRQEVRPFSDKQIELVTNFASQAVIAI